MAVVHENMENRTYEDRKKYLVKYVTERRKKIRLKAIEHLGGKCMRCGYSKCPEALDFHHKNPTEKDFNVSKKGHCRSWERVKKEIEKCSLLCANCHREIHVEQNLAASKRNLGMNSE
jgi:predicted HNH restriction endonuclease